MGLTDKSPLKQLHLAHLSEMMVLLEPLETATEFVETVALYLGYSLYNFSLYDFKFFDPHTQNFASECALYQLQTCRHIAVLYSAELE